MDRSPFFPDPNSADATGLLTVTTSMTTDMLLEAYARGIFPWSEHPFRWYSPDPRAIFLPAHIRMPRKLGKAIRRQGFTVTFDTAFADVMRGCARAHRDGGIWIADSFITAYSKLHALGFAHSVEVWQDEELVGGLYGVHLGGMFAGESMFHSVSNASKVAFAYLVEHLRRIGVPLIDAQVLNDHTQKLGAVLVHRRDFLLILDRAIRLPALMVGERWPAEVEWSLPPGGIYGGRGSSDDDGPSGHDPAT